MKKWLICLVTLLFSQRAFAQEMADNMRAEGKIYVVVAVIAVIFIGLLIYLLLLDRKISKLEKRKEEKGK